LADPALGLLKPCQREQILRKEYAPTLPILLKTRDLGDADRAFYLSRLTTYLFRIEAFVSGASRALTQNAAEPLKPPHSLLYIPDTAAAGEAGLAALRAQREKDGVVKALRKNCPSPSPETHALFARPFAQLILLAAQRAQGGPA
jgi:hypothetical protein